MLFGKRKRVVKRILIVEDEPLIAFDNETMLADEGYEVVATVDTFAEAIETLDTRTGRSDPVRRAAARRQDRDSTSPRKRASAASRCCSRPAMPAGRAQAGDRLPDQAVQYADAQGGAGKRRPASCRETAKPPKGLEIYPRVPAD